MKSKRTHEGYCLIDHRASPGLTQAEERRAQLPAGAGRGAFEAPTSTCSHCQKTQIVNPMRTRERAYCRKCDHYICDECNLAAVLSGECRPFTAIIDAVQERASRGQPIPILGAPFHG